MVFMGYVVPRRWLSRCAFWLGCFAVLMMHLGPLVSGVQGILSPEKPFLQQMVAQHGNGAGHDHAAGSGLAVQHEHHDHHALMGHRVNPHLPGWVNNLKMCGYCELLTLSPALMLALILLVLASPQQRPLPRYLAAVHAAVLRLHASPRAPPFLA